MSDTLFDSVSECLYYDAGTGALVWKMRPVVHFKTAAASKTWNTRFSGTVAGSDDSKGYRQIRLSGKVYRLHRIVWLLCTGALPGNEIDHINHDPSDNRIENLRLVSHAENAKNMRRSKRNTSGVTGVSWNKRKNRYESYAWVNDSRVYLGMHDDLKNAASAAEAVRRANGYHANHGAVQ